MSLHSVPQPKFGSTEKNSPLPLNLEILTCQSVYLTKWFYRLEDDYWRIYVMSNDGWQVRFNNRIYPLKTNEVTVIPPNTRCFSESLRGATQFYICFRISNPLGFCIPSVYHLPRMPFDRLLQQFDNFTDAPFAERIFQQTILVNQICHQALGSLPMKAWNLSAYPPIIAQAIDYLLQNIDKTISNDDIAKHIHMNTTAFIRCFHRVTGITPQSWLMKKRIEKASRLLVQTDKTIDDIAAITAFFDRAHFSKVFKLKTGLSPAAFRKAGAIDYK